MDQYADPEGFMVQLGAILEQYPDEVIIYVSDPRTGIQRRSEWPPSIAKIVEACDQEAAMVERRKKPRRDPIPRLPEPMIRDMPDGHLANIFVPEGHHRYVELEHWASTADRPYWKYGRASDGRNGIWVNILAWDNQINTKLSAG